MRRMFHLLLLTTSLVAAPLLTGAGAIADQLTFVAKTRHYTVKTDVSVEFSREIADYLETVLAEYRKVLHPRPGGRRIDFRVVLFAEEEDYHAFNREVYDYETSSYVYHHRPGDDELEAVCGFVQAGPAMRAVLRHEAFHQYLRHFVDQPPQWLNEGLAEYFEGCRLEPGQGLRQAPNRGMIRRLREGILDVDPGVLRDTYDYVPIDRLLRADKPEWAATLKESYAESWAVVHYLVSDPERARLIGAALGVLEHDASRAENTAAVYAELFGRRDMAAFEQDFLAWAREFKAPGYDDFLAGYALWQEGRYAAGLAALDQAVEADPEHDRYRLYRARCHSRLGHWAQAAADLEVGLATFPGSGHARFELARAWFELARYDEAEEVFAAFAAGDDARAAKAKQWLAAIERETAGSR